MSPHIMSWGSHRLEMGRRTLVMGIVNVTPDSFSDGGKYFDPGIALRHARQLIAEGADIVDIGGESTRPFSEGVSAEEEMRRVLPIVAELARQTTVPISIDTTKARVAREAIAAGAAIINDISALRVDPEMGAAAAASGVPLVLMHMLGTPKTMQKDPVYNDVTGDIEAFLAEAVQRAVIAGVDRSRIIVDPGIGFGKTLEHNLTLINRLEQFRSLGVPILVGPSRKAFIRRLLKAPGGEDLLPSQPLVATGTQAAVAAAALRGAHIVRVHDVADTVATLKIIDAVKNA